MNTVPEDESAPDGLPDVAALRNSWGTHEISDVGVRRRSSTSRQCARSAAGSAAVFAPPRGPGVAGLINATWSPLPEPPPRLTDHDGYDWHIHYFAPGASVADHLAADCGMALAFFVVAGEQGRLRRF